MKSLTTISIRIISLILFIQALTRGLPKLLGFLYVGNIPLSFIRIMISEIVILLIAIYLWSSAKYLSDKILGNKVKIEIEIIDYNKLEIIAFSIVGLVLISFSIPDLTGYLINYFSMPQKVPISQYPQLITKVIEIIIGSFLLINSKGIVNTIRSTGGHHG